MTKTINLPRDLVEEILSRVPLKSMKTVRLTCKKWDDLSKSQSFTKMHIGQVARVEEHKGKHTCLDEQVKISQVFDCEGLLLCILKDDSRFVVWNPYLGQTRWIKSRYFSSPDEWDQRFCYGLGYVNKESCRSYKLLRFLDYFFYKAPEKQFFWYEIYDFDSDLWTTLDVTTPDWVIVFGNGGVSFKGNTYFCAAKINLGNDGNHGFEDHIICFDFTSERFGQLLPLPFNAGYDDYVALSCVREEKLAVLHQHSVLNPYELDLWITTKIETEEVSWIKFLRMATGFDSCRPYISGSFLIDEENKVAFGFDYENRQKVIVIGEAGYLRALDLIGEIGDRNSTAYLYSYVPSLVQIKKPARGERKQQID
ncbi:F-box-like domain superfamily [Arabidopsis suecica]|uniref:F-box-like domain superfamily n=1 Tax=Arabidopsis suecica TaxID=45249 RepID=A0A8T2BAU3_ARASU|nr:F-box-like domain superfamily [Arabidopsis suecica]